MFNCEVECFENKDTNFVPMATSTFLAQARSCQKADPIMLQMSLRATLGIKYPAHYIQPMTQLQPRSEAQHIKLRQAVHKSWLQSRQELLLLSCGHRHRRVCLSSLEKRCTRAYTAHPHRPKTSKAGHRHLTDVFGIYAVHWGICRDLLGCDQSTFFFFL